MKSLYIVIFTFYSEETKVIHFDIVKNICNSNRIVKDLDSLYSIISLKIVRTNFFSFCHGPSV